MSNKSLEDKIQNTGKPVDKLRNNRAGPYIFPTAGEYSNGPDEQEARATMAIVFDPPYQMAAPVNHQV